MMAEAKFAVGGAELTLRAQSDGVKVALFLPAPFSSFSRSYLVPVKEAALFALSLRSVIEEADRLAEPQS